MDNGCILIVEIFFRTRRIIFKFLNVSSPRPLPEWKVGGLQPHKLVKPHHSAILLDPHPKSCCFGIGLRCFRVVLCVFELLFLLAFVYWFYQSLPVSAVISSFSFHFYD